MSNALQHSVTKEDVLRLLADEGGRVLPGGARKTREEVVRGLRTQVHEMLQAQVPCAYALALPTRLFGVHEGQARNEDIVARKAALAASIPDALVLESERARSGPDGKHQDAVHYVQKKHGMALWAETDRLVADALGGAS